MGRLIAFEGPDDVGKSTQIGKLEEYLVKQGRMVVTLRQPSQDHFLGFLRQEIKHNKNLNAFETQLLCACSHIIDSVRMSYNPDFILMDRTYLSGFIYGKLTGLQAWQLDLLDRILSTSYRMALEGESGTDRVDLVLLHADTRFGEADDDKFESVLSWDSISNEYKLMWDEQIPNRKAPVFHKKERFHKLFVSDDQGPELAFEALKTILEIS